MTLSRPTSPAIHAWDGILTYGELDVLSSRLARLLVRPGPEIGPEVLVPVCFEKSAWTSVAVLAVLKAGAAFVLLDPALPEARLRAVVDVSGAPLALCSGKTRALCERLVERVVVVGPALWGDGEADDDDDGVLPSSVDPESLAYVVFTSGSTGDPKGVCAYP
ncbi:Amino acid adenylation [Ophiocordyceps camponoti-floridani]|uniref:Amino acid adenylation n=1 Tax=Ophiocordyceps camponoti-floridani TaxID=2030778 RepID=A0A8H4VD02_9HYPO|nr:Amino acid adenylation [Ophiocordyceps camponoti-floridani]